MADRPKYYKPPPPKTIRLWRVKKKKYKNQYDLEGYVVSPSGLMMRVIAWVNKDRFSGDFMSIDGYLQTEYEEELYKNRHADDKQFLSKTPTGKELEKLNKKIEVKKKIAREKRDEEILLRKLNEENDLDLDLPF